MANSTTIASQTTIEGTIEGDGSVEVEGRVHGTVSLTETLTVADAGAVDGDVHVRQAIIHGTLTGSVEASERIVLSASARVRADLTTPLLSVEDGAQVAGQIDMDLEGELPDITPMTTTSSTSTSTASTRSSSSRSSSSSNTSTASAPASSATTTVVEEPAEQAETAKVDNPELANEAPTEKVTEEDLEELEDELEDQTVKELREELRRRDQTVSGTKDELIARLKQAMLDEEEG